MTSCHKIQKMKQDNYINAYLCDEQLVDEDQKVLDSMVMKRSIQDMYKEQHDIECKHSKQVSVVVLEMMEKHHMTYM